MFKKESVGWPTAHNVHTLHINITCFFQERQILKGGVVGSHEVKQIFVCNVQWDFIPTLTTLNTRPVARPFSIHPTFPPLFLVRFAELNHNEPIPEVLVNIPDRSLESATVKPQRNNKWLCSSAWV